MPQHSTLFQIGIASIDITPPLGVALAGYGPRKGVATGIGHRLRAEALYCRGPGGAWAIVTSDTVGYPQDLVTRVRERIASAIGLEPSSFMISATHTHSGPAALQTYSAAVGQLETAYRESLEKHLVEVVMKAYHASGPGQFEVAWTAAPELASNRRIQKPDGSWVNEWLDPAGEHPGYYDPSVLLIAVRRPDGRRDALLVNYGCHPVTLGPRSLRISSDYVGYMKDYLEARGVAGTVMFGLGGAGNINPRTCIQVGADYPRRMGERLGEIVLQAAAKLHPVAGGPVKSFRQVWPLKSKRDWPAGAGRRKGAQIETEVMALRAGDLVLLGIPGELFSEYVAKFRELSPGPETAVISMANDSVGYLPMDETVPQGGHEVNFAAVEGAVEEALLDQAAKALAGVAD